MKKAEIWKAALNDTKGSEQKGIRPVLIVSGNLLNTYAPVLWICPLTIKIKHYKGDLILQPNQQNGLKEKSEVLAMQLRAILKDHLIKKLGKVKDLELQQFRVNLNEIMQMD